MIEWEYRELFIKVPYILLQSIRKAFGFMQILFEDKHLILAIKAPGIPSQNDPSGQTSMIDLLSDHCSAPVFCVHRLDTAVGGVMVYAKTKQVAGALSALFQKGAVTKKYCAIVHGTAKSGVLEDLLYHDKRINKSFVVNTPRKGVKEAVLKYKTIASNDTMSLVDISLCTGRAHQIRVQFSSRKMPLLGDRKYGSTERCPIALWCHHLAFVHPFTEKSVTGDCAPPRTDPWTRFTL